MTKDQAIALGKTEFWKTMTHREIATFQMFEPLLCMPFSVFQEAVEKTLGRPVYTTEFGLALDNLKSELIGEKAAPTMEGIINLIPAEKRILVMI